MGKNIVIKNARQHNLKNISLEIPRNRLVIVTGLSGSGKSSLAFDTLYAEGQRRYVESLSAYARQFLEQMQKPEVDYIEGLSPAISIEQRSASSNPRSTVATSTEIYDYLRVLYANAGDVSCYKCGRPISRQSSQDITDSILKLETGLDVVLLAPVIEGKKGEHRQVFEFLKRDGFSRVRIDGSIKELDDVAALEKNKKHSIAAVIDRFKIRDGISKRVSDSVETALKTGKGKMIVQCGRNDRTKDIFYSEENSCPYCGISYGEISPRMFSFNSPYGACPSCHGLGHKLSFSKELVVPDPDKSLEKWAVAPWKRGGKSLLIYYKRILRGVCKHFCIDMDKPWKELTRKQQKIILYGSGREDISFSIWRRGAIRHFSKPFEGVIPNLERRFRETDSEGVKEYLRKFMGEDDCELCKGSRLKQESLSVKIGQKSIYDFTRMPVSEALEFIKNVSFSETGLQVAGELIKEIRMRLIFLENVGLGYLTLDRKSGTLSGGEAQRIRLATQIGSGLVGVLYILDEPSIGLHQKDNIKLLNTLKNLRDMGNTVIVVEHDEEIIRSGDFIVDLGPGAGKKGGYLVYAGELDGLLKNKSSMTALYLSGEKKISLRERRPVSASGEFLKVFGARENNLKNIDVKIPLGRFCCVTGVSGSGKSTLVDEILRKALFQKIYGSKEKPGAYSRMDGVSNIDKVILIDQSPIGRTPRSNPATYTGVFGDIRALFSKIPEARQRGYMPGRFSFNVKGGRCESCRGDGILKIEMHFLPDIYVECEACRGKRYNRDTLDIRYKGLNIAEVLDSTVNEMLEHFKNVPRIREKIQTLKDVGLGYIHLGQSATTLSGGEAQRVKLASELGKKATGNTLYILDEPTTGLHFDDINMLLDVLHRLVSLGNTVLVIEHNIDVIKTADYIIDLGPEGGDKGGFIVCEGTPEEIALNPESYTGNYLKKKL
ncbi:MAG: excinuclease ABC subunit UvrA [Candidatus Aureabacteria bacterium]|nr:excinuclease ABC subunit UvrA [Candidatus Auribacterota bacterium]